MTTAADRAAFVSVDEIRGALRSSNRRIGGGAVVQKIAAARVKSGYQQRNFTAIVSVFGNVDFQGDRVMPGAFRDFLARSGYQGPNGGLLAGHPEPIPVIWSHDWKNPFAHIGKVTAARETADGLEVEFELQSADDNSFAGQVSRLLERELVREFSFAFDVRQEQRADDGANELRRLDIIEVGPTLRGANPETQLLSAKAASASMERADRAERSDRALLELAKYARPETQEKVRRLVAAGSTNSKGAVPVSEGPTRVDTESAWDADENLRRLPTDTDASTYRMMFAWVDDAGSPDQIESYALPHHNVSVGGSVEAANLQGCREAVGALARMQISDDDREAAYAHLAAHFRAADLDPPELAADDEAAKSLRIPADPSEASVVITAISAFGSDSDFAIKRAREIIEQEQKEEEELEKARAEIALRSEQITTQRPQPERVVARVGGGYSAVLESPAEASKREHERRESEAKARERAEAVEDHRRFKREERRRMRVGTLPFKLKDADK